MIATVRFSKIVETVGKPSVHVLWIDPEKDAILQKAIKANRVMTIHQRPDGTKTDYGTIGFEKNVPGQVLIFPKSLRSFADKRVIGVKYDLLEWATAPKGQQAPKAEPAKPAIKSKPKEIPVTIVGAKRGIGRTFQTVRLFTSMSILENIIVASERPGNAVAIGSNGVEQHALAALDFVGLVKLRRQTVQSLSYGHQRLIEIARTLAGAPQLLLLG
jgi:hypothetical protein